MIEGKATYTPVSENGPGATVQDRTLRDAIIRAAGFLQQLADDLDSDCRREAALLEQAL